MSDTNTLLLHDYERRIRELESTALETFHKLANERKRVAELEARILTMSTVENNLRGGLKQLDRANRQLRRNYNQSLKNSNEMLEEQNGIIDALKNPWVSVEDRLPTFGDPILIVIDNVVQAIAYCFDASDISDEHVTHWYEPFHFGMDCEKDMVPARDVTHWAPMPTTPPISEGEG